MNKVFDKHLSCRKLWRPKCTWNDHINIKINHFAVTDVSYAELSSMKGLVMVMTIPDT